ncbi:MAG TPA: DUF6765 family protein, partial [Acidobacteriota bacterium]
MGEDTTFLNHWRRLKLLVFVFILLVTVPGNSGYLHAFEADLHYMWTYYLALHVGYTKRQAFQLASAAFAIDADKDTGPMEAGGKDVIFGANHPAVFGLIHPGLGETRNPRIAEIWKNFHAFQPEEIIEDRSFGNELKFVEDPESYREYRMFLASLMKEQIDNQFRRGRAEELFQLALAEGNPGPYLHYLQDFYSHALFTNFRGHVTAGHAPDFISYSDDLSRQTTETTVFGLQRFMKEYLKKAPRSSLDMTRIRQVLGRMSAANPLPGTIMNYIQGFEQLKYGWLWPFVLPSEQAIDLSRLGSPNLLAGWRVINQAVKEDEASGRLPRVAKDCNTDLPSKWVQYDFDGEGRVKNTRYRVENLNLELRKVQQEITLVDSANFRADIHLPYKLTGFADIRDADGTEFMSPLAVTESVQLSDFAEPRERHEARKPAKNSADGRSFEEEYKIEMSVERGFSSFEQGSLSYTVTVDVCGLDSKSLTGQISRDDACSEPIQTINRLFPQLGVRADRANQAARALKEILANVSSIESKAGNLVKQAEELENASMDLINKCSRQSASDAEELQVFQYQLQEAAKSIIGVRDTAEKLATSTCALSSRAESQTDATKVGRLVEDAEEFARQTRKQATEASGLLEIGQSAYDSLRNGVGANQPLRDEAEQIRQKLDAYSKQVSQLQKDLNDQLAGSDSPSSLKSSMAGAIGEFETYFREIAALPKVCVVAAGSIDGPAETLRSSLFAAQETAESNVTSTQQKGQSASEQLASAEAILGLLQEGSGPCSGTSLDLDLVDLSATLDTMDLYAKLAAESAQKAEDCASRVQ